MFMWTGVIMVVNSRVALRKSVGRIGLLGRSDRKRWLGHDMDSQGTPMKAGWENFLLI